MLLYRIRSADFKSILCAFQCADQIICINYSHDPVSTSGGAGSGIQYFALFPAYPFHFLVAA